MRDNCKPKQNLIIWVNTFDPVSTLTPFVHSYICYRLIISDGSGEALLYCYDSLVPTALASNMAEWHSVEENTKTFGELTYQKPKKSAGTTVQVQ